MTGCPKGQSLDIYPSSLHLYIHVRENLECSGKICDDHVAGMTRSAKFHLNPPLPKKIRLASSYAPGCVKSCCENQKM